MSEKEYLTRREELLSRMKGYGLPQTVGVHEGRQASAGFCPAVYAENCDPALKKLFGENWECYVFYYISTSTQTPPSPSALSSEDGNGVPVNEHNQRVSD